MFEIPEAMQYVLLMFACLVLTLPLEFVLRARVYRRPIRLLQALLTTVIVFSIWDTIAIHADLWTYSDKFTTQIILPFQLPLEELLFFIAIPLCGLLTYEAVGTVLKMWQQRSTRRPESQKENHHA